MVKEIGNVLFGKADYANIPVNIRLKMTENEAGKKDGTWTLIASNYMPRKGIVREYEYIAVSEQREELVGFIKQYVLPLYETATEKLKAICEGRTEALYYWD